jgi:hypothetical protein
MSEVQHQLLITLVHGTWGRGFFPRRQRQNRRPLWFEEGSPFLARLSGALGDVPYKITPLLWSGANSIFVRDKRAHVLAEHLAAEHAEHPQAAQVIIAHSHGGNIALRALHHLEQRDASPSGKESANPLVVTLATPFIEVHQADFGRRPLYIRLALMILVIAPLLSVPLVLLEAEHPEIVLGMTSTIVTAVLFLMGWWWIVHRASARQNRLDALKNATRLGEFALAQRLLVIRAVDDEASLTLALGAIVNYVTARSITYVLLLYVLLAILILPLRATHVISWLSDGVLGLVLLAMFPVTIVLSSMLMLARSVHGRELALSPMECQINTQSTPDAIGLSKIVTLVRHTHIRSLRHGIYDHEDCAKAISDWVRSQLVR